MIASPAAGARRELDKNKIRRENASGTAGISQILVMIQLMKLWEAANAQRSTPNAQRPSQGEMKIRGENSDSLKRDQANQGIPSEFLRLEVGM